jgi:transcriptional regulator with XRE-family HTH domain
MAQVVAKTRDPMNEIVRKNLRRFREEAKLTAEKVAAFAGISIDSLRRYEAGGSGVPYDVLAKLADIYGHSLDDFRLENPPRADLKRRPAIALMQLEGVEVDPELLAKIQKLVDEANRDTRGEKKPRKS